MKAVRTWWAQFVACSRPAAVPIRVVGRTALGPGHALFVVDVGGQRMVIGTAPQAIARLGVLDPPEHEPERGR
ncbi:MAG TPA: flagellar biosynthetic protein FliO [bacterium]|nr:flagellar biosynthetic protein FliO [bacterium]